MDKYEASSVAGADMELSGDDTSITVSWEDGVFAGECKSVEVVAAEHPQFFKKLTKMAKDGDIQIWERWDFHQQLDKSGLTPEKATCPSR